MNGTVAVGFLDPGEWSHCFGQSLIDMYLYDAFRSKRMVPHGKQLRDNAQAGGIVAGRNAITQKFLDDTDCEWLFMVDSDMGFAADTVDRLIAAADPAERPVVGGLCFSLRRDTPGDFYGQKYVVTPTCYRFVDTETETGFQSILDYPEDAAFRVDGTGAACLMIHRSAVEAIREKFGDVWFDHIKAGSTTFSEDLSFCLRLQATGLPVYVHTGVRTTHDKHGVFLDEDEYFRSRALHAMMTKEAAHG